MHHLWLIFWSQKVTLLASPLMCRSLRVAASDIRKPIIVHNTPAATTHHSIGMLATSVISVSAAKDPHSRGAVFVFLLPPLVASPCLLGWVHRGTPASQPRPPRTGRCTQHSVMTHFVAVL